METTPGSQRRYSMGAIILHWLIAIAVIVNWRIAESAHELPQAQRSDLMNWHFEIGMTILVLTVLRILWRLTHRPPPLSADITPVERVLARVTHAAFYILLISLPMLGWIGMSGYDFPVPFFGLFEWPVLPTGLTEDGGHQILEIHATLGTAMLFLIALHILGALKHQFYDRDGTLWKMLPLWRQR